MLETLLNVVELVFAYFAAIALGIRVSDRVCHGPSDHQKSKAKWCHKGTVATALGILYAFISSGEKATRLRTDAHAKDRDAK